MEALVVVSLASNVVQFIDFTCTVISKGKEIHEQGRLSELRDLERVTKHLVDFNIAIRESLNSRKLSDDGFTLNEKVLDTIATDCAQVAEQLIKCLKRLQSGDKRRPWKSFRDALKSVWSKPEVDSLAARLNSYRNQLCLQGQVVVESRTCKRFDTLDKTTQQISEQLDVLSKTLAATQGSREASGSSGITIAGDSELPCNTFDISGDQNASRCPDSSSETLPGSQPSRLIVNATQLEILHAAIGQLQAQLTESSDALHPAVVIDIPQLSMNAQASPILAGHLDRVAFATGDDATEFSKTIDRLCLFASTKGSVFFSEDAQMIIDCLDKILAAVEGAESTTSQAQTHQERKRSDNDGDDESKQIQTAGSAKRVRGLLNSARSVTVNQPITQNQFELTRGNYQSTCTHVSIQKAEGTIGLLQKKRRLRRANTNAGDDHRDTIFESFFAAVDYTPSGQLPKTKITAVFQQFVTLQDFTSLNPTLTYCAMIPDDAEIFCHINEDDVCGVRHLIERGLASLSDCDSMGRPLLYYAYYNDSQKVCKYLIRNRADIDIFCLGDDGHIMPLLVAQKLNDFETDPEDLASKLTCRRLLLEEGADPTLANASEPDYISSLVFNCIYYSTFEAVKMILDLATDFIDLEERDTLGNTCVLAASDGEGNGLNLDVLSLLLSKGANVHARQCGTGRSCLHKAVKSIQGPILRTCPGRKKEQAFLRILIKAGLEITDADCYGLTPWDYARELCFERRNVFRDALTDCGIDSTGLFVDGERCPGDPDSRNWDRQCLCKMDSEMEGDDWESERRNDWTEHCRETNSQYSVTDGSRDLGEVTSTSMHSETMSDEGADDDCVQPTRDDENHTGTIFSSEHQEAPPGSPTSGTLQVPVQYQDESYVAQRQDFDVHDQGEILNTPWSRPESAWNQNPHADSTSFASQGINSSQHAPQHACGDINVARTLNFFQPTTEQDPAWHPTGIVSRPAFVDDQASRPWTTINTNRAAPIHPESLQHAHHTSFNFVPTSNFELLYTYSSTAVWASNTGAQPHVPESPLAFSEVLSAPGPVEELSEMDFELQH